MVLREARENKVGAHSYQGSGSVPQPPRLTAFSWLPRDSTMTDNSQQPKGQGRGLFALNVAIEGLNIAKEATSTTPINPIFGSVALLLAKIRVSTFFFRNETFLVHIWSGYDGQQTGFR